MKTTTKLLATGILLALLPNFAAGLVLAAPAAPEDLFLNVPNVQRAAVLSHLPHIKRSRPVRLNPRLTEVGQASLQQAGTRWKASLFPGTEFVVAVQQTEIKGANHFVSVGHVEGVAGSQVILASVDGVMVGSISIPGQGVFQIEYSGGDLHRVNEVDPTQIKKCGYELLAAMDAVPFGPEPEAQPEAPTDPAFAGGVWDAWERPLKSQAASATNAPPVVIDFLIVYTPRALAGAGGTAGIQALIDFAITEANVAYANSQVNVRWNIVYQGLINYTESGSIVTDVTRLRNVGDGYLDQVHTLRNSHQADLVMLIVEVEDQGYAGIATPEFTVFLRPQVNVGAALVTHEVGHLLGAGHDRITCLEWGAGNCGALYSYSYGHRLIVDETTYITIMSYEPGILIPHFSNPEVLFQGVPTGVAEGATNSADNARTMNLVAPSVANLRQASNRFELAASAYTVSETNGTVSVEVVRTGATNQTVTVVFRTANYTAIAGQDYAFHGETLSFGPGVERRTITLTLLDDATSEGPETFLVRLQSPQLGSALGLASSALIKIEDDEPYFVLATTNVVSAESAGSVQVLVRRGGKTDQPCSIRYVVSAGTASEGTDFQPASGILEFAIGDNEKAVQIELVDDTEVESDETCLLTLSEPQGGVAVPPLVCAIRLLDDERPGSLDFAFNAAGGPNERVFALAVRPDGRILCGGWFSEVNGQPRTALVQWLPDGTVDSGFLPAVFLNASSPTAGVRSASINSLALLEDGKVLAGGDFASVNGVTRNHVVRLNPDGTVDPTFAPTPGPNSYVSTLAVQPDGKILIGGTFKSVSGRAAGLIARLNSDGNLDETFQANPQLPNFAVFTIALQPDGQMIVGGFFPGFDNVTRAYLMRLNTNGTADSTFSAMIPNGPVTKIVRYGDGSLLVAGLFSSPNKKLFRQTAAGILDPSFQVTPPLNGLISDLVVQADGRILIAGGFTSVPGTNRNYFCRLNQNGSFDTTFDTGLGADDYVWGVALQPNGWVCVGGMFTHVNGVPRNFLARLRSDGTRPTFAPPSLMANGELSLKLFGNAGSTYLLESSPDFSSWTSISTNTLTGVSAEWIEPGASGQSPKFYRARQVVNE